MTQRIARLLLPLCLIAASGYWVLAQVPPDLPAVTVPYRGHLQLDGTPVVSERDVIFSLYESPTPTGPAEPVLWTETHTVTPAAGDFVVELGTHASLDSVLADFNTLYLGLEVVDTSAGTRSTLQGRQLLASVPYARRAAPGKTFEADRVRAANVGGCYTHYGRHDACAPGYVQATKGRLGGLENFDDAGGESPSDLVCIDEGAQAVAPFLTYSNRLMRAHSDADGMDALDPLCSVCCRGGSYTAFGTQTCATGYSAAYTGHAGGVELYQPQQRHGLTLCVDDQGTVRNTWTSGYNTRLMRYRLQPASASANGMESVDNSCVVCVSDW